MQSPKKKNYLPLTLGLLLVLSIIATAMMIFITRHNYDQQGANIKNFNDVNPVALEETDNIIEQTFQAKNSELGRIIFYIQNTGSNNDLELSLVDNLSDETVAVTEKRIPVSENIQLIVWDFDDIADSKDKNFSLVIVPEKKRDFELLTVPSDRYDEGKLLINGGKTTDSVLAFSFDYHSDNLFPVLFERIGVYKPGLFGYSFQFIILFVLILILVFYVAFWVIKSILED